MTDHFDKWINGMSDEQYEDWIQDDATSAQEEKALNIRTQLSEQEEQDIEKEQEFTPEQESIRKIQEVEIFAKAPVKPFKQPRIDSEEIPEQLRPIIVEQRVISKPEPVVLSQSSPIAIDTSSSTAQRVTFGQRLRGFFARLRFRRNR